MALEKITKEHIWVAVIVLLFGEPLTQYLLRPFAAHVFQVLIALTGALGQSYVDHLFVAAATGGIDAKLAFNLQSLVLGVISGQFAVVLGFWAGRRWGRRLLEKALAARAEGVDARPEPPKVSQAWRRWAVGGFVLFAFVFVVFTQVSAWSDFFILKVTSSFQQHMHIVAPFLDDHDSKVLWSRWASMTSEADYN